MHSTKATAFKLVGPTDAGQSVGGVDKSPIIATSQSTTTSVQSSGREQPDEQQLVGPVNSTQITVSGKRCAALIDTGSQVTTITDEFVSQHPVLKSQVLQETNILVGGAGGQNVPHQGYILLDVAVLGETVHKVPALVIPVTRFRRSTPVLLGTNVILAVRDTMHSKHGRWFMTRARRKSAPWYSAFQCVNCDGTDLARRDGEIGLLKYSSNEQRIIKPGMEVDVQTQVPKRARG